MKADPYLFLMRSIFFISKILAPVSEVLLPRFRRVGQLPVLLRAGRAFSSRSVSTTTTTAAAATTAVFNDDLSIQFSG